MVKVIVKNRAVLEASIGDNLGRVLSKHGFLPLPCNGRGLCGQCIVRIEGKVSEPTAIEKLRGIEPPYRLACQVKILGDITVDIVRKPSLKISKHRLYIEMKHIEPIFRIIDIDRIPIEIRKPIHIDTIESIDKARALIDLLDIGFIGIIDSKCDDHGLALIDIGTTKIAFEIVDLRGRVLKEGIEINPQIGYGLDIVSRLSIAMESIEKKKELSKILRKTINDIIDRENCISLGLAAGNSAMISFLLDIPIDKLAIEPFQPFLKSIAIITTDRKRTLLALPPIAGFVGSDALADIAAIEYLKPRTPYMIIDLGTNTEIILVKNRNPLEIYVTSTPAGPAFEGYIESGSSSIIGGITKVRIERIEDNVIKFSYEGNPIGFLGSGIVSLVAELVRHKLVDKTGKFIKGFHIDNQKKFYEIAKTPEGTLLVFTQKDMREFQKALSAIRTAWILLLKKALVSIEEIEYVFLTGSFGMSIDIEDALLLRIVPPISMNKIVSIGNAVPEGLKTMALDKNHFSKIIEVAYTANHVELAKDPRFSRLWIENLALY